MKRNMDKIISEVKIPRGYDISVNEALELKKMNNVIDAIAAGFKYGFALAQRYEKAQRRKEQ